MSDASTATSRHGRRLVVAVTAVGLAVSGAIATGLVRAPGPARPAPVASAGRAEADPSATLGRVAAVEPLLTARAAAVAAGRRSGWDATLDPASTAFRARQLTIFDRVQVLPVSGWHYELLSTTLLPSAGTGGFVAAVELRYRLPGDTRDVVRREWFTVVHRPSGWRLAGDGDGGRTEEDLWDAGPLSVVRGRRSVVVGVGTSAQLRAGLRRTASETDAAATRVDAGWGASRRRTVVVVVPATVAQMAFALGRSDARGLDQVAAVTTGELARGAAGAAVAAGTPAGSADRVVLNPTAFAALSPLGRRVVLTHELTHVATRAQARVGPPLWVEEGFADYVAYSGTGLSRGVVADEVLPQVRAGTAPAHLPDEAAFDETRGDIGPAYADAWLAFDLMAHDGVGRPAAFYRVAAGLATSGAGAGATDRSAALAAAFSTVLHTDQAAFEVRWRAWRAGIR